jgi:hypothetical protein
MVSDEPEGGPEGEPIVQKNAKCVEAGTLAVRF